MTPTFGGNVVINLASTVSIDNMMIGNSTPQSAYLTNVSASGNITGSFILGNGSQLTGLPASYSNAQVAAYLSSGTVTTNILTTAAISATGNVNGNIFIGTFAALNNISVTGNIRIGNSIITTNNGNLLYGGNVVITGNSTGNNITANLTGTTTGLHNGLVDSFDIKALSWDFGYITANTYTNPIQYLFAVTPAGNIDMGSIVSPAPLYIDIGSINASTTN